MKKRENWKNAGYFAIILILVLVFLLSGLRILESTVLHSGTQQEQTDKKTIIRDGIAYFPRQDITVLLVMGIDQLGPVQDSGYYRNEGAADMVMLMIFDETAKEQTVLYLNRDTMLTMPVLGIDGRPAGHSYAQLALSHTYGSGLEESCENVRETVSDFLYGIQIDYYVSMNMDAIALANDAVGGVTVNVTEDFSAIDDTIPMGKVTLNGRQAIQYVRTRHGLGDQLNLSRMERQKKYVQAFAASFKASAERDADFVAKAYEQMTSYMVTDCTVTTISNLMSRFAEFEFSRIVTPEGENVLGEEYYEFHVDEAALDDLILELFYRPKT